MIYNSNEIQAIIPHRFPFLYVDGIEEIDQEKKTIKGIKNVSVNEYPFLGHFPQKHVFPGVLIVEALAQTGCVLLMTEPQNKGKIGYLAGINHMRFYRPVIPGDQLELYVEMTRQRMSIYFAKVEATVKGKRVCQGEIMCALGENG